MALGKFLPRLIALALIGWVSGFHLALATGERGTEAEAQALVGKAVAEIDKMGPDAAYKEFSDTKGAFVDRDLYLVVFDRNGTILAHGANNALIGVNLFNAKDPDGVAFVQQFWQSANNTPSGGWVNFKFTHPQTKKIERKVMWVVKKDETIVVAGAYPAQ